MNRYTIYCTEEQTKKALELGAPIKLFCKDYMHGHINYMGNPIPIGHVLIHNDLYYAPTAEQMIGWLEEKGLHISIIYDDCTYKPEVRDIYDGFINNDEYLSSRKEAIFAAIDTALKYLTKNKK